VKIRASRAEGSSLQRGFAMIALLALAALISAFLIASALSLTSAGVSNEREDRSMSALRKAKAALIAYAANEQWQLYRALPSVPPAAYFQPGALLCPDQDDDGDADCFGSNTASMIGRLPFKTLGIDDLRDASGERLWYALSHDFRKLRCSVPPAPPITGCTTINSDTLGQLTVTGMAPATQVVAIVFAPGAALDLRAVGGPQQDRTSIAAHNDYTNYLENVNLGDNIHFTFTSTGLPTPTSNDRLLAITQADLIAAVEPVVAANIARDVKPLMQDYFTKWGAYPFAMTFAAPPPSVTAYQGASGQQQGLLPLTDDPTWFKWWKATVTQIPPGGSGTEIVTSWNCSVYSSPLQAVCHVSYTDGASPPDPSQARPDIKIQIFLQNANTAFGDIPSPITLPETTPNFRIDADGGGPVTDQYPPYGYFSKVGLVAPTTTFATQTAVVAETGVIVYTGRLQNSASMGGGVTITIPLPTPKYLPIVSGNPAVNPNGAWFISNQWYRQAYYAVSQGYVSGGVPVGNPATCSPLPATPSCLTVNNLPAPKNNKSAILVLTGRALGSQTRPSGNPADYLEGQNSTPADLIFEHRAGTATTINDRVVVVSP
jgi:type II secretory pathway pseudopilin PulG